jgi:hypothetical protein
MHAMKGQTTNFPTGYCMDRKIEVFEVYIQASAWAKEIKLRDTQKNNLAWPFARPRGYLQK